MMRRTERRAPSLTVGTPINGLRDDAGAAAVEFGLIAPLLVMLLLGIMEFGLVLNNYVELTNAARAAGRQLAISRTSTTPWTNATNAFYASTPNMTTANITITLSVNGVACNSDSTCATALATAQGDPSELIATYPCNLDILNVNFVPGCTLSAQTTEQVE
jgi:Flp pilus assembly protein TadG